MLYLGFGGKLGIGKPLETDIFVYNSEASPHRIDIFCGENPLRLHVEACCWTINEDSCSIAL